MRDYASEAQKILSVYLQRGNQALQKLQNGSWDEATELMRLRGAAYHNFKVLDAVAQGEGVDVGADPQVQSLVAQLSTLNLALNRELELAHDETAKHYAQIRETRRTIGQYMSSKGGPIRFEQQV